VCLMLCFGAWASSSPLVIFTSCRGTRGAGRRRPAPTGGRAAVDDLVAP
jgi:hypothetical protein